MLIFTKIFTKKNCSDCIIKIQLRETQESIRLSFNSPKDANQILCFSKII